MVRSSSPPDASPPRRLQRLGTTQHHGSLTLIHLSQLHHPNHRAAHTKSSQHFTCRCVETSFGERDVKILIQIYPSPFIAWLIDGRRQCARSQSWHQPAPSYQDRANRVSALWQRLEQTSLLRNILTYQTSIVDLGSWPFHMAIHFLHGFSSQLVLTATE